LIGEKISKKDTAFRKAISVQERLELTLRFDKFYDTFVSLLHFTITKRSRNRTTLQIRTTLQDRSTRTKRRAEEKSRRWWRVTLHVQTCSGRKRIIPLIRQPNAYSTPNMLVTLLRNQLLIRYVVTSLVHTVTKRRYGTR
jgi:hypothetical protein